MSVHRKLTELNVTEAFSTPSKHCKKQSKKKITAPVGTIDDNDKNND